MAVSKQDYLAKYGTQVEGYLKKVKTGSPVATNLKGQVVTVGEPRVKTGLSAIDKNLNKVDESTYQKALLMAANKKAAVEGSKNLNVQKDIVEPIANTGKSWKLGELNIQLSTEAAKMMEGKSNNYKKIKSEYDKFVAANPKLSTSNNIYTQAVQQLPQKTEQWKQNAGLYVGGTAAGAGIGAGAGSGGGPVGAIAAGVVGAYKGYQTADAVAAGIQAYSQEAGSAYVDMLDLGIDEPTAKKYAKEIGVINAAIETGGELTDLIGALGVGKVLTKGLSKYTSKIAGKEAIKKFLDNAGVSYVTNIISEGSQEAAQQAVTQAKTKDAATSVGIEYDSSNDLENILRSGMTGAGVAALIGGVSVVTKTALNKAVKSTKSAITPEEAVTVTKAATTENVDTTEKATEILNQVKQLSNVKTFANQISDIQTQINDLKTSLDNEINVNKQQAIMAQINKLEIAKKARQDQVQSFSSSNPVINTEYVKATVPQNIKSVETMLKTVVDDQIKSGQQDAYAVIVPVSTDVQKVQTEIAAKLGIQVVYFDGNITPEEATIDNVVFVNSKPGKIDNVSTSQTIHWSLGHGIFHALKTQHPDLFNQYIDYLQTKIDPVQIQDYLDTIKNDSYKQKLSDDRKLLIEEMTADEFGNMFSDGNYWTELSKEKPKLFKQLVDSIIEILDKIIGVNFQSGLTGEQVKFIRDKFVNETLPLLEQTSQKEVKQGETKYTVTSKKVISDVNMKIKQIPKKGEKLKLDQVISHPELFAEVPKLKNVTVVREDSNNNTRFSPSDNTIYITNKINTDYKTESKKIATLLHEIQHSIQRVEKMPHGTNVKLEAIKESIQHPIKSAKVAIKEKGNIENIKEKLGRDRYTNNKGEVQARKVAQDYLDQVGLKYTDRTKTVGYSQSRLDSIINEMSDGTKSKGYLTKMSPNEYLDLTAGYISRMKIEDETKPLDLQQLKNEKQNIMLQINKRGKVVGHQGRHRMQALKNEKFETDIPVVVYSIVTDDKSISNTELKLTSENNPFQSLKPRTLVLKGQGSQYDYDRAEGNVEVKLDPVNDTLDTSKYQSGDVKYSGRQLSIAPEVKVETGEGKSKFATNSLTTQQLFDSSFALSEKQITDYKKTSNADALQKATDRLKNNGNDEIQKWFSKPEDSFDDVDVAEGIILMNEYYKIGDVVSGTNVAKKLRNSVTKGGQRIQAISILSRMTPEGMIYYTQSELTEAWNKLNDLIDPKIKKWAQDNKDLFTLNQTEVEYINNKMEKFVKLDPESREAKIIMGEIQALVKNKIPPEKGSAIKGWTRISMLFNPKTLGRNILGNITVLPVNAVADVFGTGIDIALSKQTGVRTTGLPSLKTYKQGQIKGIKESFDDYRRDIDTRSTDKFESNLQAKTFKNKYLNKVDRLLTFGLDVGDRGFYQGAYMNSLANQMKLNKVSTPTADMLDIAREEALQRTWQDKNGFVEAALSTRRILNKLGSVKGYGLGDMLVPFAVTPANIAKAIFDYSPAAAIAVAKDAKLFIDAKKVGKLDAKIQKRFVNTLSKAMAGTLLYVMGYALANAGIISGSADDDKDNSSFMKTLGLNSYSIKVGGTTFTYDWAQPVATPLAIMADIKKMQDEQTLGEGKGVDLGETANSILNAIKLGGSSLFEQSFLQSIATLFDSNSPVEGILENISALPSRFVPTLFKQVNDLIDPYQRQQWEYNNLISTAYNKVIAKIPGMSSTLPASKDVLGQDIKKYSGDNSLFNVFFNPSTVYSNTANPVATEIKSVYDITGDSSIIPKVAPNYVTYDGTKYTLTNDQKLQYQELTGTTVTETLQDLITSDAYNNLTTQQQNDIIADTISYATEVAKANLIDGYESSVKSKISKSGLSDGTYMMYSGVVKSIDSDEDSYGETIAGSKQGKQAYIIMNMNISTAEKNAMLDLITTSKSPAKVSDLLKLDNQQQYINYFALPAKDYFVTANISREDYQNASDFGIDSDTFTKYSKTVSEIKSDIDKNGDIISGSKKKKVLSYINSLSLNGYQRVLLMATMGYSVKSYQNTMYKYINNLAVSAERKQALWDALGYK